MKKSYYCNRIETSLNFLPERIAFCCGSATCPSIDVTSYSKEKILTERKRIKDLLKQGVIPFECSCCFEYKEQENKNFLKEFFQKKKEEKIKHIIINHYKQCDCNCIYCTQKMVYEDDIQNYELLPILKEFFNQDWIDIDNLRVEFQGGNVSMLKEFPAIIDFLKEKGCREYFFLVNHIKYLKEIEETANISHAHACISLDSGSREVFKQIKKVDAFDIVIENIKRLKNNSKAYVSLKYIIISGVNDSIEEVKKFCNIVKEVNANAIYTEIDFRDTLMSSKYERNYVVPKHYYEIVDYFKEFSVKNNIDFSIMAYSKVVFENGCA